MRKHEFVITVQMTIRIEIPEGKCYYCLEHKKFFGDHNAMESHMNSSSHTKDKKAHSCSRCLAYFRSRSLLLHHQKSLPNHHTFPFSSIEFEVRDDGFVVQIGILETE